MWIVYFEGVLSRSNLFEAAFYWESHAQEHCKRNPGAKCIHWPFTE